ncbi:hypothetical protein AMECASPLE_029247 [Ameca splendens]|uniref:Uncharacterized protein n=1 Tax=Ameca splendens TaxID=208324 RepID=A0ABV0XIX7_9TELE
MATSNLNSSCGFSFHIFNCTKQLQLFLPLSTSLTKASCLTCFVSSSALPARLSLHDHTGCVVAIYSSLGSFQGPITARIQHGAKSTTERFSHKCLNASELK